MTIATDAVQYFDSLMKNNTLGIADNMQDTLDQYAEHSLTYFSDDKTFVTVFKDTSAVVIIKVPGSHTTIVDLAPTKKFAKVIAAYLVVKRLAPESSKQVASKIILDIMDNIGPQLNPDSPTENILPA